MADAKITREDHETNGRWVATVDGVEGEAEMTYSKAGTSRIIIDHTDVAESMAGMGMGKKLVEAAVLAARAEGFKIIPLCPFAKATLEKMPEWQDVVQ
ncbi:MAG: GNAT family N-acetyltransferase [Pseudomonadota bacterium]